jgi:hypothetical protein
MCLEESISILLSQNDPSLKILESILLKTLAASRTNLVGNMLGTLRTYRFPVGYLVSSKLNSVPFYSICY